LMLAGVIIFMTDSLDFLAKQQPKNAHIQVNNLLQKMGHAGVETLPQKPIQQASAPIKALFTTEYKDSTFKLWAAVFFGFLTLYTLMSWVPNIAKDAGLPFDMATYVGIALNAGAAIGTTSMGFIAGKLGLKKTVLGFMLSAFIVMVIYGNITLSTSIIFMMIFLIGIFVQGGFNGMYPTMSRVYPTEIRTTGVGFSIGIGRFGAILGPALFGFLSDSGISIPTLFSLFSVPLLITALCVWSLKSKNLN